MSTQEGGDQIKEERGALVSYVDALKIYCKEMQKAIGNCDQITTEEKERKAAFIPLIRGEEKRGKEIDEALMAKYGGDLSDPRYHDELLAASDDWFKPLRICYETLVKINQKVINECKVHSHRVDFKYCKEVALTRINCDI